MKILQSRRRFLETLATSSGALLLPRAGIGQTSPASAAEGSRVDYTLRIEVSPVEIAPKRIISMTTYNGQFPGPLVRLKEGQRVTIDILNNTDVPEQLHWHGQMVPAEIDGASEEGTPFIPAHGKRRITLTPTPAGFRFYHTHTRAGANLAAGQYSGEVGPVYIESKNEPGNYDREVFLVLKEFGPTFSRGGDMAQNFLPPIEIKELKEQGESTMKESIAKRKQKGYEVDYEAFTINGRMLGHGEPIRVKQGERILFHILNGSATEMRSLALPGHTFRVTALDGNPVPRPVSVPLVWIGTAERVSAIVEMKHPGVWIMGDLDDDDRRRGMGVVVEYASQKGKAQWTKPAPYHWNYLHFAKRELISQPPDETFEMIFAKDNAAERGFNRWTINGVAYPMTGEMTPASFHLKEGKRYRVRMRNASDDIHPVHLHRHSFELTKIFGQSSSGILKDVVMLGGYQEAEIDFVANNPGLTLFHCHQQLHMDFGFMTLFDYI